MLDGKKEFQQHSRTNNSMLALRYELEYIGGLLGCNIKLANPKQRIEAAINDPAKPYFNVSMMSVTADNHRELQMLISVRSAREPNDTTPTGPQIIDDLTKLLNAASSATKQADCCKTKLEDGKLNVTISGYSNYFKITSNLEQLSASLAKGKTIDEATANLPKQKSFAATAQATRSSTTELS